MTRFGGMGGLAKVRKLDHLDAFEMAVENTLGDQIRKSDDIAIEMWSALANVEWVHLNGDQAGYSFRAAGDLISAIRGEGNYMDWYCSGPYAVVSYRISGALWLAGWAPIMGD